jgi:hypothetical protein
MEFAYFETEDFVNVRGKDAWGLGLPANILEQFYCDNARRWYPGL